MSGALAPLSLALAPDALTLQWQDRSTSLAASVLRGHCRCAPCQSARLRGASPSPDVVALVDALPVGHYAVQLRFSDGHDRGIYPWAYLQELGEAADPS